MDWRQAKEYHFIGEIVKEEKIVRKNRQKRNFLAIPFFLTIKIEVLNEKKRAGRRLAHRNRIGNEPNGAPRVSLPLHLYITSCASFFPKRAFEGISVRVFPAMAGNCLSTECPQKLSLRKTCTPRYIYKRAQKNYLSKIINLCSELFARISGTYIACAWSGMAWNLPGISARSS